MMILSADSVAQEVRSVLCRCYMLVTDFTQKSLVQPSIDSSLCATIGRDNVHHLEKKTITSGVCGYYQDTFTGQRRILRKIFSSPFWTPNPQTGLKHDSRYNKSCQNNMVIESLTWIKATLIADIIHTVKSIWSLVVFCQKHTKKLT